MTLGATTAGLVRQAGSARAAGDWKRSPAEHDPQGQPRTGPVVTMLGRRPVTVAATVRGRAS